MPQIMSKALDLIKTIKFGDPVLNLDRSVASVYGLQLWSKKRIKLRAYCGRSSLMGSTFLTGHWELALIRVLRDCRGLAVLHVLRAGLHSPSASGSGVVVSRLPGGKWSGASAIVADYVLPQGVDVVDIVLVINNQDDLDLISSPNGMLGKGLTIEPGPISESDAYAAQLRKMPRRKDVVLYYLKSKGHLAEMDLRHMVIREKVPRMNGSMECPAFLRKRSCRVRLKLLLVLRIIFTVLLMLLTSNFGARVIRRRLGNVQEIVGLEHQRLQIPDPGYPRGLDSSQAKNIDA